MTTYIGSPVSSPSWKTVGVTMLRTMLNDAGADTYTTSRLEDLLVTAAYFLPVEVNFVTTYVINIQEESVSPDPLAQTDGPEFISLAVLKAACMLDESAFRTSALLQGVTARCGPAVIDTGKYGEYLKTLLTAGPCQAYQTLKQKYNFSYEGKNIIRAVMSPFASNDFYPI